MDCSPPSTSVHSIFQVRILEWVAISFSIYIFKCFFIELVYVHKCNIFYIDPCHYTVSFLIFLYGLNLPDDFAFLLFIWPFLVSQLVKDLPAMQETPVQSLGQKDPLQKG